MSNEEAFFVVLADKNLWTLIKSFMFPKQKSCVMDDYTNGDIAAMHGYIALILHDVGKNKLKFTKNAMDYAAGNGHLEVVKWLHTNRTEGCTKNAMDWAARNGHLEVVKWLHTNKTEGYTKNAMDWAARNGHLEVVKWLNQNWLTSSQ
jgi:ankyrin repeat protein